MKLCQYKWIAIFSVLILSILITLYATYKCPPEKIPYFYMNFIEDKFPEPMTIFVYGGNAIISSAEWLKKAWEDRLYVKKDFNKELKVFNLDQFMEWSNREF